MMDGILNILKPPSVTSFDIVKKIRSLVQIKKVGHTGTLDPDAVGVLPICLGKATRVVEYMMDDHKLYRAEVTLGQVTDTQDSRGKVLASTDIPEVDLGELKDLVKEFLGVQQQVPPMVSAVKYQGRRLYELARQGIEVERQPRRVEIFALKILRYEWPRFWIDVSCSKGTYIRTLAHDIGQALGCGAHLSYLIRTATGVFTLEDSVTIAEILEAVHQKRLAELLLPIDWGLGTFQKVLIKEQVVKKAINGVQLQIGDYEDCPKNLHVGQLMRIYFGDKLISLSKVVDPRIELLKPVKVFE